MITPMIKQFLNILFLASACCTFSFVTKAAAAMEIHSGSGDFIFAGEQGNTSKPIRVWYYRPSNVSPETPIVFVMHGVNRNGREYRDSWVDLARTRNFLLICPEFSERDYPTRAYQQGNVIDESGHPLPKEKWTYCTIEQLFDFVKGVTYSSSAIYYIYGHSAGAQFVHRLVLLLPKARYARAIAANPGWYTMPNFSDRFPYGLSRTTATKTDLTASLGRDFLLLLGEEDTKTNSENLRQTPKAEAQGKTRLERGHNYYRAAQKAAAELGASFGWKLQTVPGAGHSNRQMEAAAVAALFNAKK
jgi:poly(3-hydroxybutyrate) depolymerase